MDDHVIVRGRSTEDNFLVVFLLVAAIFVWIFIFRTLKGHFVNSKDVKELVEERENPVKDEKKD